MTPTQKELQLKLTVTADPSGGVRALQQLAAQAQATQAAMGGASGAGGAAPIGPGGRFMPYATTPSYPGYAGPGGYGGYPSYPTAMPSAPGGMPGGPPAPPPLINGATGARLGLGVGNNGGHGGGGMGALKGAAMLAVALKAADTAGAVGRAANDSFLTTEQAGRQLFREVVPFGGHIQNVVDSVTGRQADFELADVRSRQRAAAASGRTQILATQLALAPQLAGQNAQLQALNRASPILEGTSDRSTAVGERAFREKQRLLPLERESAKAEREAAVASAQRAANAGELVKIENKMAALQSKRVGLQKQLEDVGSGVERQRILHRLSETESEIQATGGLQQEARRAVHQSTIEAAQARHAAGMVGVRKLQEEAGILEERAATTASGAARLGSMNRFQRRDAVRDLQAYLTYGRAGVTDQQFANVSAVAPETVRKQAEKEGAATPEFQALRRMAPADYAGDVGDLQKKAAAKRDEAVKQQLDLDRELARASSAAGADLGRYLADVITKLVQSAQREIENQIRLGKNRA